jgi:hypothetical protein
MAVHRSRSKLIIGRFPALLLTALGVTACGEADFEGDESVGELWEAVTFPAPRLDSAEASCLQVSVRFTPRTAPSGWSISKHQLERAPTDSGPWAAVRTVSASTTVASDYHYLRNRAYSYRVRTYYKNSSGATASSNPSAIGRVTASGTSCTVARATSGTTMKVNVFLMTPANEPVPYDKAHAQKVTFDATFENSLYRFFDNVSAGFNHTSAVKHVRIGGKVIDWQKLARSRISDYPGGAGEMCTEIADNGNLATLTGNNPADYQVFVFNSGAGGGLSGCLTSSNQSVGTGWVLRVGGASLLAERPYGVMAHEIGHGLGLRHEYSMYCPNGVPLDLVKSASNCTMSASASATNLMSKAAGGNYFSGYHKWKLGFLTDSNVVPIDFRAMTVGQTAQAKISGSTASQGATTKQLVAVQLDDAENMYILQYRTAGGHDTFTNMGSSWPAFPAGLYVYLRPGQAWDPVSQAEPDDVMKLHTSAAITSPLILQKGGTPYLDAQRGLEISVNNTTGAEWTVMIKRK